MHVDSGHTPPPADTLVRHKRFHDRLASPNPIRLAEPASSLSSSLAPGSFPSAEGSVNRWADFNSCGNADTLSSAALTPAWDLVTPVGAETYTAVRYSGCPANASAELWRVHGGSHTPRVRPLSKSLE